MPKNSDLYIRNIIFGISDSLVSTVGLLSGVAVSGVSGHILVLTGVVYAFVEAFSMAVGSFFSEQLTEEYKVKSEVSLSGPLQAGIIMFISFLFIAFIPIAPYLIFSGVEALLLSIGVSILTLFIAGSISAKVTHVNVLSHATKMVLLGGAAIVLGVVVGRFVKS